MEEFDSFYVLVYRTPTRYGVEALTFSETAARNAYARELDAWQAIMESDDEAFMLVKVLTDCVAEADIEKLKSYVGKGATNDRWLDVNMTYILSKSGSVCDVLEYYSPDYE